MILSSVSHCSEENKDDNAILPIQKLPLEIQDHIASFLKGNDKKNLSLCSKNFYDLIKTKRNYKIGHSDSNFISEDLGKEKIEFGNYMSNFIINYMTIDSFPKKRMSFKSFTESALNKDWPNKIQSLEDKIRQRIQNTMVNVPQITLVNESSQSVFDCSNYILNIAKFMKKEEK